MVNIPEGSEGDFIREYLKKNPFEEVVDLEEDEKFKLVCRTIREREGLVYAEYDTRLQAFFHNKPIEKILRLVESMDDFLIKGAKCPYVRILRTT